MSQSDIPCPWDAGFVFGDIILRRFGLGDFKVSSRKQFCQNSSSDPSSEVCDKLPVCIVGCSANFELPEEVLDSVGDDQFFKICGCKFPLGQGDNPVSTLRSWNSSGGIERGVFSSKVCDGRGVSGRWHS